ncbi:MAG: hypothetical protein A4S16_07705 [Proteobacteria bacterium SG_bin6]|nr:MAG: hypothetical protein A4S16_07705 [Proteobacteria bacterium SG_bin6]
MELSVSRLIFCLPILLLGACDRQSAPQPQAPEVTITNSAEMPAGAKPVAKMAAGAIDRSHKGQGLPTYAVQDAKGAYVPLNSFLGRPMLLNLWATWCAPCVKELPQLDTLAGKAPGGLRVIAVSQDLEGLAKVKTFLEARGIKNLPPLYDDQAKISGGMGVNLPTTILYDSQGNEVWRTLGDRDWTSAETAKLLAEAR